MKKVGILTFHASHNYGSMLQAYALQHFVDSIGLDSEIINYRTEVQKRMYVPIYKKENLLRRFIKFFTLFKYIGACHRKYRLFEDFMRKHMKLSREYNTEEELAKANFDYDYYISGSDQIWNPICTDFSWAYFLSFVKKGKKIAYAPSMGAMRDEIPQSYIDKMRNYVSQYDALSVREEGTKRKLEKILDDKDAIDIAVDPTLLLSSSDWENFVDKEPLVKGKYLFFYAPVFNVPTFEMARKIAQRLDLPIIISQVYGTEITYKYKDFNIHAAVGPKEFLNLCKNATLVCGNSFHLIVFSILFKTPFFAINGMYDNRVKQLLTICNLQGRAISKDNFESLMSTPYEIDFSVIEKGLRDIQEKSKEFLVKALR